MVKKLTSNKSYTKVRKDSINLHNQTEISGSGGGNLPSSSSNYKPHQFVLSTATMGGEPIAQPSQYIDEVYAVMLNEYHQPPFSTQGARQSSSLGWKGSIAKEGTPCGGETSSTRVMNQDRGGDSPLRQPSWTNFSSKFNKGRPKLLKQQSPVSVLSQGAKVTRNTRVKAGTTTVQGPKSTKNQQSNSGQSSQAAYTCNQKGSTKRDFLERTNHLSSTQSTALIRRQGQTLSQTDLMKNLNKAVSLKSLGK